MLHSIKDITKIVNGKLLNGVAVDVQIAHLLLDSRQILYPQASLFFALKGKHHNGHKYITDLYKKGVRNFVVSEQQNYTAYEGAHFIFVKDTLKALQNLAASHRNKFSLETIGITGSNGKTIIKEWLFHLLHKDYSIVRSPRSYNSQTGVPLSVWQIKKEHQLGIFEAGISEMEEMDKLRNIINCSIGLFTNIGPAHSEGFVSIEKKINEKVKLFENAKTIIYCSDDPRIVQAMTRFDNKEHFTWSRQFNADLKITSIEKQKDGSSSIIGIFKKEIHQIFIPFHDAAHIENAIHCWAILLHFRIAPKVIEERMKKLESVAMRLEIKDGINGCSIINDSYNSDLNSLQIALHFLEQQSNQEKQTLILSDILQSGQTLKNLYQEVAEIIIEKKVDRFIGIGTDIKNIKSFLPPQIDEKFYPDTQSFIENFDINSFQSESILIKGARQFGFERIAHSLSQKVHKTVLEINLNALTHNLHVYSQYLQAGTRMMVMVKASAYGSGSYEVARLLEFNKVDYLAVAYTDEGASLREAGIQLPIMVLNPDEQSFDLITRHQLEPEIYNLRLLKSLIRYLPKGKEVAIHLKMDTGMKRLGFDEGDLGELLVLLKANKNLKVQSVFSHLAASEDDQEDIFSKQQVATFKKLYDHLTKELAHQPLRHILNSSGIVRFPQHQMDMVRLGIGLYGIDSSEEIQDQLEVVQRLKATISQIKQVAPGETIGYSRKGKATKPLRIATISIGYADGLLRGAGNGNYAVYVNGKPASIIGNVCMDMCMIDITPYPEVQEGDEVVIFGDQPSIRDLAESLGTISYEVFTNISSRVKRVYFQE